MKRVAETARTLTIVAETGLARRAMLRAALAVGAIVFAAEALSACAPPRPASAAAAHPMVGVAAHPFELPSARGAGVLRLEPKAGTITIVDFWGVWCEPCKRSFPAWERISKRFAGKVRVVAVNVDDSADGIEAFLKETGATFEVAYRGGSTAEQYGARKMPTSFFVDGNGVVQHVHEAFADSDEAELVSLVEQLIAR